MASAESKLSDYGYAYPAVLEQPMIWKLGIVRIRLVVDIIRQRL